MGRRQVSLPKISPPTLSGIAERKRLFVLLDQTRRCGSTWISGPPGSGKTVLLADYLRSCPGSRIWYQFDEGDGEPATFFHYMGLAALKAAPRKKKPLPHLTPEYLMGLPTFTRNFFRELYSRLKPPFCLVLDDYHVVPEESPLHELLSLGIDEAPEGGSVLVLSRGAPPRQYSRLRVSGSMAMLDGDDLSLTIEESFEIVRMRDGSLDKETVLELHRRSGGWAAGFVLLLEGGKPDGVDINDPGGMTHQELFDYFSIEILDRMDPETRDLLQKTSVFPRMTSAMASDLTGISGAERMLEGLSRDNHFTSRHPGLEPVYRYHDLFRDLLLASAEDRFTSAEMKELRNKAAGIMDASGYTEDAAELYCETEDWESLASLIKNNSPSLLAQGRNRALDRWLGCQPHKLLNSDPWLLYWSGASLLPFNPAGARVHFEKALGLFRSLKDSSGAFLAWSGLIETYTFGMEFPDRLLNIVSVLDELLDEFGDPPDLMIEARVASAMFWALMVSSPQQPETIHWERRALELADRCGDINIKAQVLTNNIYHQMQGGNLVEAEMSLGRFRKIVQSKESTPLASMFMSFVEPAFYIVSGDEDAAVAAADEWLSFSASTGVHAMDTMVLGDGALGLLNKGDIDRAQEYLDRMGAHYDAMRHVDRSFYHYLLAHKSFLTGDVQKALTHSEVAYKEGQLVGNPLVHSLCLIARGYVTFASGDYKKASVFVKKAMDVAKKMNGKMPSFYGHICRAHIELASGRTDRGLGTLRKAMAFGSKHSYYSTYTWYPEIMAKLCAVALEHDIETEYVKDLISRRGLMPESPPVELEAWPWPVRVFTFGRFSLVVNGHTMGSAGKTSKRPLEMLKALIGLGGREVSEESLTDILWPDSAGDTAHSACTTTLSRLRKLLGSDDSVIVRDGRVTLNPRYCWVDTWALERLLGRSAEALKNGDRTGAGQLCQKAAGLYHGPFLATESAGPWVLAYRERLRSRFIRHVGDYGRASEDAGDYERAIECFRKGLEVEPLAEEFCQRLMVCLKKTGLRVEAAAAYKNFKKILSATLGVEPSERTEEIFKSL